MCENGFRIRECDYKNLNINIVEFSCGMLGISVFPWMKYLDNSNTGCMHTFIDFRTLNTFRNGRTTYTIIHEVGHCLGLRHVWTNSIETNNAYLILLNKYVCQEKTQLWCEQAKNLYSELLTNNNNNIYPDIPKQDKPNFHDPFITKKFMCSDDGLCNFTCFMDYSPDTVMIHFTPSQKKIMRTMIRIFKPSFLKSIVVDEVDIVIRLDNDDTKKYKLINDEIDYNISNIDDLFKSIVWINI